MPVTASNGFPSLKKKKEHKQMKFSWLPIFSLRQNFWKSLSQIAYLLLGLQHFGNSFLDPMWPSMCSTVHVNKLCRTMLSQYYSSSMCPTLLWNLLRTCAGYLQFIPIHPPTPANLTKNWPLGYAWFLRKPPASRANRFCLWPAWACLSVSC